MLTCADLRVLLMQQSISFIELDLLSENGTDQGSPIPKVPAIMATRRLSK